MIELFPFKWEIDDKLCGEGRQEIWAWSKLLDRRTVLMRITDWPCRICIELPGMARNGAERKWDRSNAQFIYEWLCEQLRDKQPYTYDCVYTHKLFNYNNGLLFPFMQLDFRCSKHVDACQKLLARSHKLPDGEVYGFPVHEAEFSDTLKFIAYNKLTLGQWFFVPERKVNPSVRVSQYEYELSVPYYEIKSSNRDEVPDFGVSAFDLEQFSHRWRTRTFPEASFVHDSLISASINHRPPAPAKSIDGKESKATIAREVLTVGQRLLTPDTVLRASRNEADFIADFFRRLNELDPDFIIGFNTTGFDAPCITIRRETICHQTLPHMGRLRPDLHEAFPTILGRIGSKNKAKQGKYWQMTGRIFFDLRLYAQREFSNKFANFTLENVAQEFLK